MREGKISCGVGKGGGPILGRDGDGGSFGAKYWSGGPENCGPVPT